MSYVQDMEKAKDIVSDSYAYMLERKDTLSVDLHKMKAYLMQTVKHRCLDFIRHENVRSNILKNIREIDIEILGEDDVTGRILERDISEILADAGIKMKKQTFDIFISSRIGGMSHKEIALKYGMTPNKVAKEIMQAMKIMKTVFRDYLHLMAAIFFNWIR